jgi:hypothetical protein
MEWYKLHAGQRMQMVGYWLVASGLVAGAYVDALAAGYRAAACALALLGAASAVGFVFLDSRTRTLLSVGEDALDALEARMAVEHDLDAIRIVGIADARRSHRFDSYRSIIWTLESVSALAFVAAAVAALV